MEHTIMLVDDVRLFLEIQKEFLQNSPVKVTTAKNGVEALHAITIDRPDLVFMDLEMPEMDGADCCRAIKSKPLTASVPVVMITAKGDDASRLNCHSAGCNDFLTKPLDRKLFLDTASRFLANIDRRDKRIPVNVSGSIRSRGSDFPCILYDLSVGGAFIASDFNGDVDRAVQLSFTLPDGSTIECHGKITWFKLSNNRTPVGFGVNFVLLPRETKDAITNFLVHSENDSSRKCG